MIKIVIAALAAMVLSAHAPVLRHDIGMDVSVTTGAPEEGEPVPEDPFGVFTLIPDRQTVPAGDDISVQVGFSSSGGYRLSARTTGRGNIDLVFDAEDRLAISVPADSEPMIDHAIEIVAAGDNGGEVISTPFNVLVTPARVSFGNVSDLTLKAGNSAQFEAVSRGHDEYYSYETFVMAISGALPDWITATGDKYSITPSRDVPPETYGPFALAGRDDMGRMGYSDRFSITVEQADAAFLSITESFYVEIDSQVFGKFEFDAAGGQYQISTRPADGFPAIPYGNDIFAIPSTGDLIIRADVGRNLTSGDTFRYVVVATGEGREIVSDPFDIEIGPQALRFCTLSGIALPVRGSAQIPICFNYSQGTSVTVTLERVDGGQVPSWVDYQHADTSGTLVLSPLQENLSPHRSGPYRFVARDTLGRTGYSAEFDIVLTE